MFKRTSVKISLVLALASIAVSQLLEADAQDGLPLKTDHYLLHDACAQVLNEQISWELYASMVYMNMGGYFDRPSIARSGYAKYFRDQSREEYDHASQFVEYVNRRNGTVKRIAIDESPKSCWTGPREALSDAINLEKHVYSKLRHIHDVADQKCQDPHLQDFLESNFFTEQVDSIRELQTMLTTISSYDSSASQLVEYNEDARLKVARKAHDDL